MKIQVGRCAARKDTDVNLLELERLAAHGAFGTMQQDVERVIDSMFRGYRLAVEATLAAEAALRGRLPARAF